jgi:hypothetical protein
MARTALHKDHPELKLP